MAAPAAERTVGVGYETVVDAAHTLPALAARLDEVNANSVTISVGRLDWTAFPWDAHPELEAVPGTDHAAEQIKALGTGSDGRKRRITLTIDLLIPGWISRNTPWRASTSTAPGPRTSPASPPSRPGPSGSGWWSSWPK